MELVSPAGNVEKLAYAWEYGADAAYIGLKRFSLRVKADNFHDDEYRQIRALKEAYAARGAPKRLFCALNISFHDRDIDHFLAEADYFRQYPFDAFIIQDPGMIAVLSREFPGIPLHLSTQANCVNGEAAKFYRSLGFKRVVLGREASLADIARIKDAAPELELECFAHGAMCIAYSGRCLMSAYMTGRSANAGHCSHSCRWDWRLARDAGKAIADARGTPGAETGPARFAVRELQNGDPDSDADYAVEERARPGEYYPVIEGDDFTALFSSKDLCMIDYLADMKKAGVDSLKIEGRMKSLYYAALVTRAYRKRLDALEGLIPPGADAPFAAELENVAHRAFTTGFYFSPDAANETTKGETAAPWMLAGTVGPERTGSDTPAGWRDWEFRSMNKMNAGTEIEYVGPDTLATKDADYALVNPETGETREWVSHGHPCLLRTKKDIAERWIVRMRDPGSHAAAVAASTGESRIPRSLRNAGEADR